MELSELINQAEKQAGAGEFAEACATYRTVLERDPAHPGIRERIGDCLLAAENWAEAAAAYEEILQRNLGSAVIRCHLGLALLRAGRERDAVLHLTRAVQEDPALTVAYHHLADAQFLLGRWHEAIPVYQEAIRLNPDYVWSHINLGRSFRAIGRIADAVPCFRRAVALDATIKEASFYLALTLEDVGDENLDGIVACYRTAQELDPTDSEVEEKLKAALDRQVRARRMNSLLSAGAGFSSDIEGYVDFVDGERVDGWVRDKAHPGRSLEVDVYFEDRFYTRTRADRYRNDVAAQLGCDGCYGFHVPLPALGGTWQRVKISVKLVQTGQHLSLSPRIITLASVGKAHADISPTHSPSEIDTRAFRPVKIPHQLARQSSQPEVSLIVLNLDGARLLEQMFQSFVRHNSYQAYKFIVVDHGSKDNSVALLREWSKLLPLEIVERGNNFSFSESNNYAVNLAQSPLVLFLNNDIVFCQDILPEMVRLTADENIAAVGAQLFDAPVRDALLPPLIQHLGIQFHLGKPGQPLVPLEMAFGPHLTANLHSAAYVPAVTGALMICRREDFRKVNGFDERYYYNYEDVDLCLKFRRDLRKEVVCAGQLAAFHHRASTRSLLGDDGAEKLAASLTVLIENHGYYVRRSAERDFFLRSAFWQPTPLRVGFAVSAADLTNAPGDFFTAFELGECFTRAFGWKVHYLTQQSGEWYDVSHLDVLIVMLDEYDLRELRNAESGLLKFAWARNWFERWRERPWAEDYDGVWASAEPGAQELSGRLAQPVSLMPLATNWQRFAAGRPRQEYASDYCFTGNYWHSARQLAELLDPSRLPHRFALYGRNWESCEGCDQFRACSRGPVAYRNLPDVYASTKIVVDDANIATARWGSVNARVFDALAAGALVITNGRAGSERTFDGLLPVYESRESLERILTEYLEDDSKRRTTVETLQALVKERHTYRQRAEKAFAILRQKFTEKFRIAIKIAVPNRNEARYWGDFHFARGLKRAFERLGHSARIDIKPEWEDARRVGDHVTIVLRGLGRYTPLASHINLLWNISHPDKVSTEEYELFDRVFVASTQYTDLLRRRVTVPVHVLLQCTDPELFYPDFASQQKIPELLFVGNSRKQFRPIVRQAIEGNLPLVVYGRHWDDVIPQSFVKGEHIPNDELRRYYSGCRVLLNDHWESMRRAGFVSNRIFDALACGATVISDPVPGLKALFGDAVHECADTESLRACVLRELESTKDRKAAHELSTRVRSEHSFDQRAKTLMGFIETLHSERMARSSSSAGSLGDRRTVDAG